MPSVRRAGGALSRGFSGWAVALFARLAPSSAFSRPSALVSRQQSKGEHTQILCVLLLRYGYPGDFGALLSGLGLRLPEGSRLRKLLQRALFAFSLENYQLVQVQQDLRCAQREVRLESVEQVEHVPVELIDFQGQWSLIYFGKTSRDLELFLTPSHYQVLDAHVTHERSYDFFVLLRHEPGCARRATWYARQADVVQLFREEHARQTQRSVAVASSSLAIPQTLEDQAPDSESSLLSARCATAKPTPAQVFFNAEQQPASSSSHSSPNDREAVYARLPTRAQHPDGDRTHPNAAHFNGLASYLAPRPEKQQSEDDYKGFNVQISIEELINELNGAEDVSSYEKMNELMQNVRIDYPAAYANGGKPLGEHEEVVHL